MALLQLGHAATGTVSETEKPRASNMPPDWRELMGNWAAPEVDAVGTT